MTPASKALWEQTHDSAQSTVHVIYNIIKVDVITKLMVKYYLNIIKASVQITDASNKIIIMSIFINKLIII